MTATKQLELTVSVKVDKNDDRGQGDENAVKQRATDLREGSKRDSGEWSYLRPAIGSNQCTCFQCGECFSSVSVFDMHQRIASGKVICTYPLDIVNTKGEPRPLVRNKRGWWVSRLREEGTVYEE